MIVHIGKIQWWQSVFLIRCWKDDVKKISIFKLDLNWGNALISCNFWKYSCIPNISTSLETTRICASNGIIIVKFYLKLLQNITFETSAYLKLSDKNKENDSLFVNFL